MLGKPSVCPYLVLYLLRHQFDRKSSNSLPALQTFCRSLYCLRMPFCNSICGRNVERRIYRMM